MSGFLATVRAIEPPGWGILIMRLVIGFSFLAHSLILMLGVLTLPGVYGFLESIGIPGFMTYVVFTTELAVGTALILGIQVRWASLAIIPILLGAVWVRSPNGWAYDAPGGGWEYAAFWAAMMAALALLGDGPFALSRSVPFTAGRSNALQTQRDALADPYAHGGKRQSAALP